MKGVARLAQVWEIHYSYVALADYLKIYFSPSSETLQIRHYMLAAPQSSPDGIRLYGDVTKTLSLDQVTLQTRSDAKMNLLPSSLNI